MPGFLLAFVLTLLVSLGGRDQMLVAQLSAGFRRPAPLLATAWTAAVLSAAAAAWAGAWLAPMMPPGAKTMLLALALGMGAVELVWRALRKPAPREPTRSLAAILIVLVARQLGDGARFVVFALAVASASAPLVAAGAAIGGAVSLTIGWLLGDALPSSRFLAPVRTALAAALLLAAAVMALGVLDII